jgi:hypothetical protein
MRYDVVIITAGSAGSVLAPHLPLSLLWKAPPDIMVAERSAGRIKLGN